MKRAKNSCISSLPSVCQCDLMPSLWCRVWILPPPWSRNEISAIGKTDVKAALQQVENELEKCFWQASLTYYRVTFRYQIDSSRSWHWTSVLLITLLWVGSADRREPHHDRPIHSDRETRSTDRPSCIRKVTSLNPGSSGVSYGPLNSFEFTLVKY